MAWKQKLAEIFVDITAKTAPIKTAMAKANAIVKRGYKAMSKWIKRGAIAIGVGLAAALAYATKAAMVQEKAEGDLAAALRTTGDATKENIDDLKEYAAELQKLTVYGDEAILVQMAYAKNLGVATHQLKEAAKAAIGLAAKYKLDLVAAMMLIGRASQGQTQMLTRYGIVLDEGLSAQGKFNAVLKIGADAFSLAEAEADTFWGKLKQFKNELGDLAEKIGDALIPHIEAAIEAMGRWIEKNAEWTAAEFAKAVKATAEAIKASIDFIKEHGKWVKWATVAFGAFLGVLAAAKFITALKVIGSSFVWLGVKFVGALKAMKIALLGLVTGMGLLMKTITAWTLPIREFTAYVGTLKDGLKITTRFAIATRWAAAKLLVLKAAVIVVIAAILALIFHLGKLAYLYGKFWRSQKENAKIWAAIQERHAKEREERDKKEKAALKEKGDARKKRIADLKEEAKVNAQAAKDNAARLKKEAEENAQAAKDKAEALRKELRDRRDAYVEMGVFPKKLHKVEMALMKIRAREIAKLTGISEKAARMALMAAYIKEKKGETPVAAAGEAARVGFVGIREAWAQIASGTKRVGEEQLRTAKKQLEEAKKQTPILEKMAEKSFETGLAD